MEFKAKEAYKKDAIVNQYDQKRFFSIKGRFTDWVEKSAIRKAIIQANLAGQATIIDVPSGTGRLSCYLAEKKFRLFASDISVAMVKTSRKKVHRLNLQDAVSFLVVDAVRLAYINNAVDAIVSLRLFGHVPPPIRVNILKEFARVSKKYLIITYYAKNSWQGYLRKRKRRKANICWYPVTFAEIDAELQEVGLEKIQCFPIFRGIAETVVVLARKKEEK